MLPTQRRHMNKKIIGYIVLVAMLPVAVLGLLATSNEYRAIGVDAVDCDGPLSVLIFAVPALATYAIAAAIFVLRLQKPRSLILGGLCGLICAGLVWNAGNAVTEHWRNSRESACGAGL